MLISPPLLPSLTLLSAMRVGYDAFSPDFSAPGDRRRFCAYARARKLQIENTKPGRKYDLVVVSAAGDVARWGAHPHSGTPIIFDLTDSYLALPRGVKDTVRGLGKFALGELSRPALSYRAALERMCRRADAVVCTTVEQQDAIEGIADNVHVILDIQDGDVSDVKTDYAVGDTLNLFWEGLPYTLPAFKELRDVFAELGREHSVAMHLMTDLRFGRWSRRVGTVETKDVADRLFERAYLYEWNRLLFSRIASSCDLGVIPLDYSDPLSRGKPENKLLLMWRVGLPTITSASPAYCRAMAGAGIDMVCATVDEWNRKLRIYASDEATRRDAGTRGKAYAEREFGSERMLARWDRVLESIGL